MARILVTGNAGFIGYHVADRLLELGVYVIGFSYPVVPMNKARIRTQMSAAHSREQLEQAVPRCWIGAVDLADLVQRHHRTVVCFTHIRPRLLQDIGKAGFQSVEYPQAQGQHQQGKQQHHSQG